MLLNMEDFSLSQIKYLVPFGWGCGGVDRGFPVATAKLFFNRSVGFKKVQTASDNNSVFTLALLPFLVLD